MKFQVGDLVDYDMWAQYRTPRFWWEWTLLWCRTGVIIPVDAERDVIQRKGPKYTDPLYRVEFENGRTSLCDEDNLRHAVNPHVD